MRKLLWETNVAKSAIITVQKQYLFTETLQRKTLALNSPTISARGITLHSFATQISHQKSYIKISG